MIVEIENEDNIPSFSPYQDNFIFNLLIS